MTFPASDIFNEMFLMVKMLLGKNENDNKKWNVLGIAFF